MAFGGTAQTVRFLGSSKYRPLSSIWLRATHLVRLKRVGPGDCVTMPDKKRHRWAYAGLRRAARIDCIESEMKAKGAEMSIAITEKALP
jgi:hypothetical protein